RRQIDIDRRLVYTVGLALLGGMLVLWNNNVTWELSVGEFRSAGEVAPLLDVVVQYLRKPAMGPLLLAAILAAALVRWPRSPVVAVLVVAAASAMAAHTWDQRGTWTRIIESYAEGDHPFSKYIAPTEEVYWSDEALAPWMMLHRRTYVSSAQMAGVAFNRESGEQMERRSRVVALFEFQRDICGLFNAVKTSNQQACEPDVMTMRTACETDPKLSWLITTYSLEQAWTASWNAEYKGRPYRKYFLYGCRQLLGDKARNPS
ncbi:MAG: hypothetical protein JWP22_4318, partial [Ramlibacter sp.]|nr:hypothetical protein [Ramlibacter sp.]